MQNMLHQMKAQEFYTDLGDSINSAKFYRKKLNSRTFQGFWVIFKYFSRQI